MTWWRRAGSLARELAVFAIASLTLCPGVGFAEQQSAAGDAELVRSMGLPGLWHPHIGLLLDVDRQQHDTRVGPQILGGVYRDLLNPSFGAFGLVGEGYFKVLDGDPDGGFRFLGASPFFGLQGGLDYSIRENQVDGLVSLVLPLRRGGLFGRGDQVRVDYFPGRDNSVSVGLTIPFGNPGAGKTRPQRDNVRLPRSPRRAASVYAVSEPLTEALTNVGHAAGWIERLTTPFLDRVEERDDGELRGFREDLAFVKTHIAETDALYPTGHTFEAEIEVYHQELQRAFTLAAGGAGDAARERGAQIADKARRVLLDEVIWPYNRLLGQRKTNDSLLGLGSRATQIFEEWVDAVPDLSDAGRVAVPYVFQRLLGYLEEGRRFARRLWEDSRLVWIPLHYAIRLDEHRTQRQIDAILQEGIGEEFSAANDVDYVINEQFQGELYRMIHATETYHVLWIHDFRGRTPAGTPDDVGFRMAVEGYLSALTDRVKAYDRTGKIPLYMIMLDQFFFEANDGRRWMALLQDPLGHKVRLPSEYQEWSDRIQRAQDELRIAVDSSPRLQADAARHGDGWLENQIKVHVNITNPADFSFRSHHLVPFVPFAPDIAMRDHRKIAFYDATERDPSRGEALYTGMGVGEHYAGPTWDDRALLVRGPAIVHLKEATRRLLREQGFAESEIPAPLRVEPRPADYGALVEALERRGWNSMALEIHNATGYGPKPANVVKATLYELMPAGSHLYVPDSLWNSPHWAGMLTGAALRGCLVFVIAPALENAPSDAFPQMSRANEVFTRLVIIQKELEHELSSVGGLLAVGIYNLDVDTGDVPGKARALSQGVAQTKLFRQVFPFDESVYETIAGMEELLLSQGFEARYLATDITRRKPKLHYKTQLFISGRAVETLMPLSGWADLAREYILRRARQTAGEEEVTALWAGLGAEAEALGQQWRAGLSPAEREEAVFFLTIGSQNQDYRGKIMDGEVMVVVSDAAALVAYLDFFQLMGLTTWVTDPDQVDALLPRHGWFQRKIGRLIKNML